jgi:hypothetical protein
LLHVLHHGENTHLAVGLPKHASTSSVRLCNFGVHVDGLGVEGDLDVVLVLVPLDGPAGAGVEAVAGAEVDAQGLYPSEVALQVRRAITTW